MACPWARPREGPKEAERQEESLGVEGWSYVCSDVFACQISWLWEDDKHTQKPHLTLEQVTLTHEPTVGMSVPSLCPKLCQTSPYWGETKGQLQHAALHSVREAERCVCHPTPCVPQMSCQWQEAVLICTSLSFLNSNDRQTALRS